MIKRKPSKRPPPELEEINFKNTGLLSKYTSDDGKISGRKFNGLDAKKQRAMKKAIKQARAMGLLPFSSGYSR